ncbi:uncharacterized protein [Polyergus mexicanus]|uniref:uncharacterized protein n=1 Tax=Polyergus mexicanus TaxID=615972 RepID=UPI0038B5756E
MTPTFCWVFLLALVGRAASMPQPLVVDACALICNPGAETESERERDPKLYPRYPKVNCKLQSDSEEHQAWVLASHCLKLCNRELTFASEANCFALRSSLGANLGCYCEAFTPLSPNTMRLYESWRLNFLVKELANDILNVIAHSPLDKIILCNIHEELFSNIQLAKTKNGNLVSCYNKTSASSKLEERASESLPIPAAVHDTKQEPITWTEILEDTTMYSKETHSQEKQDNHRIMENENQAEEGHTEENTEEHIEEPVTEEMMIENRRDVMDIEKNPREVDEISDPPYMIFEKMCENCIEYCKFKKPIMLRVFCNCEIIKTECKNRGALNNLDD